MNFERRYEELKGAVEETLLQVLNACGAPEPLHSAMRYSLLAGGKRIRAIMLLAACEMAGGSWRDALPYSAALEMIHTYSLIHDDLPAMDDDDLRRGKPTNHKVYGEGMALLAGDGLLSLAFETMLAASDTVWHIYAMRYLAKAAGVQGMVAGQCTDMTCEKSATCGAEELAYIHLHKTADLFIGAVMAGLSIARAPVAMLQAGEAFATSIGLAFQIQDDLLDCMGSVELLGKATGADAMRGKLTWPSLYGTKAAQDQVNACCETAMTALLVFGDASIFLARMVAMLRERNH